MPARGGGANLGQPWFFSVFLLSIILCFCCSVCGFAMYSRRTAEHTEKQLQDALKMVEQKSKETLLQEKAYGTPVPVHILRMRYLVRKALNDQVKARKVHKEMLYRARREEILEEVKPTLRGKSKEEKEMIENEARDRLSEEKEICGDR